MMAPPNNTASGEIHLKLRAQNMAHGNSPAPNAIKSLAFSGKKPAWLGAGGDKVNPPMIFTGSGFDDQCKQTAMFGHCE